MKLIIYLFLPIILFSSDSFILKTTWGQKKIYSKFTPKKQRVGCWSTALGQILYHHKLKPLEKSVNYKISKNETVSFNIDQAKLNFDKSDKLALSYYSYYISGILQKDFGTSSYLIKGSKRHLELEKFFKNIEAHQYKLKNMDKEHFILIIKHELDNKRPLMLFIRDKAKKKYHAVVADGYKYIDSKLHLHINMGSYGKYNDWYDFDKAIHKFDDNLYRRIITIKVKK